MSASPTGGELGEEGTVLVTGAAGFIGFHLAKALLQQGRRVVGYDNLNDYYDVTLKEARLGILQADDKFRFHRRDLEDAEALEAVFREERFAAVVHLAAQAGVRYSLVNPRVYIDSNIVGFFNVIDACRKHGTAHFLYASSSSVYGLNRKMPFAEGDNVDHPISLYAASKKSNELVSHAYSYLYGLPTTGLRFFTVYGPWGRPDMALFRFCRAIQLGEPVHLYNRGEMERDFTYVDDIVDGILGILDRPALPDEGWSGERPDPASSLAPYRLYNIGAGRPVPLRRFLALIEEALGKRAEVIPEPMQPGDIQASFADVSRLAGAADYEPKITIEEGIPRFVEWFREYYSGGRPIPSR
ncbi:MAG TPA: NAD-dependent epimerase [Bacteroidetes bacterium]|nr:NAD-dependent epimerase [Bacteroidota bacterium]